MRMAKKTQTMDPQRDGFRWYSLLCISAPFQSAQSRLTCRQPQRWLMHKNWAVGGNNRPHLHMQSGIRVDPC